MTLKTLSSDSSVEDFLNTLDESQQQDSKILINIMQDVSGQPPVMWGSSIIGFGSYRYKPKSGKEAEWMKIGFSPRKGKLSLYITGAAEDYTAELNEVGKHSVGKGCIYFTDLKNADTEKLKEIIERACQLKHPYEV